jgi:hypothetical protein
MQKIEITDEGHCLVDGDDWGEACDVILNHLSGVDPEKPAESLSYRVARALGKKCVELCERCDTAEERASDFIPQTDDEIELRAQAKARQILDAEAVETRAREIIGETRR